MEKNKGLKMEKIVEEKNDIKTVNKLLIINRTKEKFKKFFFIFIKNFFKGIGILSFPIVLFLAMEFLNGMLEDTITILKDVFSLGFSINTIKIATKVLANSILKKKLISLLITEAGFLGIYGITGKLKRSMIMTSLIGMILAVVNYLLVQIRGTSITPTDFYSIGMVYGMKKNINIKFSYELFLAIGLIVIGLVICSKIKIKDISKNKKTAIRITSIGLSVMLFLFFFKTDVFGIEISYNTKNFYKQNGIATSFLTTIKSMKLKEPEGYSTEKINSVIKNIEIEKNNENDEDLPNIVVIMNESLSDLKSLYNLNISEDNMPFIHSLRENTIKANVHSSSLGGKTANCEWEFLTGNTSRFLPVGAVTYQLYVKQHIISIVDTLNSKGYYTAAFHPYKAEGYNRNIVYPLMGFNESKFEDELENLYYSRYDYADDLSTFKNITKLFDEKEKKQKIFNFTVTMQNHMSYNDGDFENNVYLKDFNDEKHFEINQYLSSVKKSDEAFEYIVNYFKKYDEPTIIMMFGDHQPNLVDNYPEIFGKISEKHDENKYIVPMILWANYDIEEKNLEDISMNYLANILFDTAGIEKTKYMYFLNYLYKKHPVITTNVYKELNSDFNKYENIPEELKIYEYIQYNNMFDDEKIIDLYKND